MPPFSNKKSYPLYHEILRLEPFNINYNADITGVSRLIIKEKIFVFVGTSLLFGGNCGSVSFFLI